jgi:hypothetical protein
MPCYRIVKWFPDRPAERDWVAKKVFTDMQFAEEAAASLREDIPYRRFAVEEIDDDETDA